MCPHHKQFQAQVDECSSIYSTTFLVVVTRLQIASNTLYNFSRCVEAERRPSCHPPALTCNRHPYWNLQSLFKYFHWTFGLQSPFFLKPLVRQGREKGRIGTVKECAVSYDSMHAQRTKNASRKSRKGRVEIRKANQINRIYTKTDLKNTLLEDNSHGV